MKQTKVVESTAIMSHWFKEGLRFECTECGKCCTGSPGYVWVTEEDIVQMAEALELSVKDFMRKYIRMKNSRYALIEMKNPPYDCIFLKDKKCQVYQARPKQCRTFPWWQHNLNSKESWDAAAKECEGISDLAPLHSEEDILKHL